MLTTQFVQVKDTHFTSATKRGIPAEGLALKRDIDGLFLQPDDTFAPIPWVLSEGCWKGFRIPEGCKLVKIVLDFRFREV